MLAQGDGALKGWNNLDLNVILVSFLENQEHLRALKNSEIFSFYFLETPLFRVFPSQFHLNYYRCPFSFFQTLDIHVLKLHFDHNYYFIFYFLITNLIICLHNSSSLPSLILFLFGLLMMKAIKH